MHNFNLSELINKVIVDLVSDAVLNIVNQQLALPQSIVVVFSGQAGLCYASVLQQLLSLPKNQTINIFFSNSALQHLSKQKILISAPTKNIHFFHDTNENFTQDLPYDLLLLPELSLNSLAKSVNHIADNLPAKWIQQALLDNKRIVVTFDYLTQHHHLNPTYQHDIDAQISKLIAYNIELASITDITTKIKACYAETKNLPVKTQKKDSTTHGNNRLNFARQTKNRLIASSQVRCHNAQTPLYLGYDTLVTPLAMDIIRQKNIPIIKG